jgi:ribosome-binding protein aMBF1 (putative translation factor)
MTKADKTYKTVREVFKKEFEDQEFKIYFEEERVRSEIALAVSNIRKEAGLTQQELADKIETTQSVIARLESGKDKRITSLPMLARILAATGKHLFIGIEPAIK